MANYLLDTNVILEGIDNFISTKSNCGIIIPTIVLEELNHIKETREGEIAFKARRAMRELFEIKKYGNLNEWIKLDNDVSVHVHHHFDDGLHLGYTCNDDIIVGSLSDCAKTFGNDITLVSSDLNIILKAEGFGFKAENFKFMFDENKFYSGHRDILVDDCYIDEFYDKGEIDWNYICDESPLENQCVTLTSKSNPKKQALTIFKKDRLNKLKYGHKDVFGGTKGQNRQQKYLIELLMDESIPIVAVNSAAGTGKSFISTVVGLQKVLEENRYDKILYVKPLTPMGGAEIGYNPGEKNSKLLNGYAGTISNILENIFSKREKQYSKLSYAEDLIEKGILQVEAMTYMRGMSYYRTFMIIDESSNISKLDIKNILTRCGEGSKCCVIGDASQLDNTKLTIFDNGLQHTIESLKGSELFGTIRLDKSVRSEVAQLCVERL